MCAKAPKVPICPKFVVYWSLYFLFSFSQCKRVVGYCSFSYSRTRYFKGQTWLMLKSVMDIRHYRLWCIWQEFLTKSKQKPFLRKTPKWSVEWMWDMQWVGIVSHNFVQRVLNQILESGFQPLKVISLYLFATQYCGTIFSVKQLLGYF